MARDILEVADFESGLTQQGKLNTFRKVSTQNSSAHYLTDTFLDEVGASNSSFVVRGWRGGNEIEYKIGGRVSRYPTAFLMMTGASDSDKVLLRVLPVALPISGEELLAFYPTREVPISLTHSVALTVVTHTHPFLPGIYLDHGSRRWGMEGFDGWLSSSFIPDLIRRV